MDFDHFSHMDMVRQSELQLSRRTDRGFGYGAALKKRREQRKKKLLKVSSQSKTTKAKAKAKASARGKGASSSSSSSSSFDFEALLKPVRRKNKAPAHERLRVHHSVLAPSDSRYDGPIASRPAREPSLAFQELQLTQQAESTQLRAFDPSSMDKKPLKFKPIPAFVDRLTLPKEGVPHATCIAPSETFSVPLEYSIERTYSYVEPRPLMMPSLKSKYLGIAPPTDIFRPSSKTVDLGGYPAYASPGKQKKAKSGALSPRKTIKAAMDEQEREGGDEEEVEVEEEAPLLDTSIPVAATTLEKGEEEGVAPGALVVSREEISKAAVTSAAAAFTVEMLTGKLAGDLDCEGLHSKPVCVLSASGTGLDRGLYNDGFRFVVNAGADKALLAQDEEAHAHALGVMAEQKKQESVTESAPIAMTYTHVAPRGESDGGAAASTAAMAHYTLRVVQGCTFACVLDLSCSALQYACGDDGDVSVARFAQANAAIRGLMGRDTSVVRVVCVPMPYQNTLERLIASVSARDRAFTWKMLTDTADSDVYVLYSCTPMQQSALQGDV
jgi:hypothetical protein